MYKFIQYTNFYFKYLILSTRICNKNLNVYKIIFRDKYLKWKCKYNYNVMILFPWKY